MGTILEEAPCCTGAAAPQSGTAPELCFHSPSTAVGTLPRSWGHLEVNHFNQLCNCDLHLLRLPQVGKESVTYENRIIIHSDSPDVKGQRDRSDGLRRCLHV